ncbi:3-hydroxybutyryl-CoA dehydrogenase [Micromonospora echinofusca]|uniref:3-hydroxybutyryl-CoA dehydrogenase n=1 Tax=Micromonospora echinofusca TaxID=47858 RepID=A0ABS3VIR7_MICEH|nr:3-hydroxybutyryl-CoA dehydrogenase [Micromonospora echinofusca]
MQEKIAVIGAGTMGVGVSHAFAAAGHPVVMLDVSKQALDRAEELISRNIRYYTMLGAPPEPHPGAIMDVITLTTDLEDVADADFVVENVTENWDVKKPLYQQLEAVCKTETVFGVNTSAIPITRIAGLTGRPEQVIGVHFMNPVPLKPLVEVIHGFHTSDETVAFTRELIRGLGKDSLVVEDSPGFVTNRVMMLMVNEAICLLQENVAGAPEIDRLFTECFGHRMGPLATADLIGLDTVLYSLDVLLENFNDPKYRPSTLLRKLVDAGHLGCKSGQGFFSYA